MPKSDFFRSDVALQSLIPNTPLPPNPRISDQVDRLAAALFDQEGRVAELEKRLHTILMSPPLTMDVDRAGGPTQPTLLVEQLGALCHVAEGNNIRLSSLIDRLAL